MVCTASDQCHTAGTCDSSTGICSNPQAANGTSCTPSGGGTGTCQNGACVGAPTCTFVCPPEDLAGLPLLTSSNTNSELFCQYQVVPNDFFCKYFLDTGLLKQDHDDGFCPPVGIPQCSA